MRLDVQDRIQNHHAGLERNGKIDPSSGHVTLFAAIDPQRHHLPRLRTARIELVRRCAFERKWLRHAH